MPIQRRRRDPERGEQLKREGMDRADRHAPLPWKAMAMKVVREMSIGTEFTTDHIWIEIERRGSLVPPEPRAMGAVMGTLARSGLIAPTDKWEKSERPEAHRRPMQVWKRTS